MSDCILCGAQAQQRVTPKSGEDVIELDAVAYSYGGGELLSDMSLTITPGAFYFLTGPSGAGKTTFLKMCYAALRPTSGALKLFGQDVQTMDRNDIALVRRRIGVVHQDCQFIDHLSVADNIALPLSVAGQDNWDDTTNLKELLAWVGLSHRADALPPELSGGERQRAALARAIIMSPDIVLADEPTGNLDEENSQVIADLLFNVSQKYQKSLCLVTHDLELAKKCDRLMKIDNGTII